MKLLLTSAGFTNKSISKSLLELTKKPFNQLKIAFIPTAANVEEGGKEWLINDLDRCKKLGFASIDIVDFSAVPKDIWQPRLKEADVLLLGGGNTFHLMYWLRKSGLNKLIPNWLKTKVYIGISAGSIVASKSLSLSTSKKLYSEEIGELEESEGLGLVTFHIRPHLNSSHFPKVRIKNIEKLSKKLADPVYVIDDNTAIVVNDRDISVVSEGKWKKFV